ncbi:MAG: translocation/assembly module TamB domain-containing protein [Candidatus Baltobacteraceae bacterium]
MHALRGKRPVVFGTVLAAVAVAVLVLLSQPALSRNLVASILGHATGTAVSLGGMHVNATGATLTDVLVSAKGERLARIPRIEVRYTLHDLLPGSTHLYGLHAVDVYRPRITVVHKPDGTYNLPALAKGGPSTGGGTPMNVRVRVIDGSMAVLDKTRVDPSARDVEIARLNVNADIHTAARTVYRASMAYVDGRGAYPIRGGGILDAPSGFTLHHWTAAHVPLPQIVNYALNNSTIRMRAGYLDNLDARYYGNLSASASIRGARVTIAGVGAAIENVRGPLDMTSAGLTTSGLIAQIAGAPVSVKGGIYDLKDPQFRLHINARNEIARLKLMAAAAAKLPISGPVDIGMLVQGPVRSPLALIALRSPALAFRAMPLRDADAAIAFDGKTANVLHLTLRYAAFSAAVRGRMALQKHKGAIEAFASADGNSAGVPYASDILAAMPLHAALLATGESFDAIQTQGTLSGGGADAHALSGAFAISGNGAGGIALRTPSLAANVRIDHPHNALAALLHANALHIDAARTAALPGLSAGAALPVSGTLNGDLFAAQQSGRLALAGNLDVQDAAFRQIAVTHAHAQFRGGPGAVNVPVLNAQGSFGDLQAHGTMAGTNYIALQGHLRGSLAQLASVAGSVPAQGYVDAPIALVYDHGRSVAQVQDAQFRNGSVRGVPIDRLSATVAQQGGTLNVYAARASVTRGGSAVASGAFGSGGSNVALSIANLPLAQLSGAGLPVQSGVADVAAIASGSLKAPDVRGAVVVDRMRYGKYPISANGAFAYAGSELTLNDALVGVGPAFAAIDGAVYPRYDLTASVRGADAHDLIALASPALQKQYIEGSLDASVHVTGAGAAPAIGGTFDAPEGSVNGLAFRELRGAITGTPADLHVNGGRVTVGSTALSFHAVVAGRALTAGVNAPHADLADFNDYFDAGDTLAGTGRLAIDVASIGRSFASSGNVALNNVRYKRFPIGDALAAWHTSGATTIGSADIGGEAGRVRFSGSYAPGAAMNVRASLRGLDLGTWLPLVGFRQPVTGHVDADATARGRYPDMDLGVNAALLDGTVGRVHIEQAQLAMNAARGRGRIQRAIVRIPNFEAQGSGTFGLHPRDPLGLSVHASSPDLGKLLATMTGKTYDAGGTLDTTLALSGTRVDPQLRDAFTLTSLHYAKIAVPKMWGTVAGNLHEVSLEHGEIDLQRGRVLASGHVPLRAPRNAAVAMNVRIENVDFSNFQSAFPKGDHLAGTMAGAMNVSGNVDNPKFSGNLALHNGYFVGPIDQNPISHVNGTLAFTQNTIAIQALHANVGAGTMDVSGIAQVPNFRRPGDATFSATILADNAQINSPKYFRGKVNGNVTATRVRGGIPTLAGSVSVPSGRIPLTAFWNPKATKSVGGPALPLAFNLNATVGNDVRVQSPGVDVGAQGSVAVGGTLASPTLDGAFTSTGGTVTFLRRFDVQSARVRFDKTNGIMPYINAVATTTVSNPVTDIALHVTGLAPNNMQIAFDSSPGGYSREQILAMLTGVSNLNNRNSTGGFTAGGEIQNLAMGQLNTYFTQQLLEPLSASLGNALGLQNLQLTDDFTSGFGFNAVKAFGKHITAVFSQTMGTPSRRSLSIEAHRGNSTAFNFTMYSSDSPPLFGYRPGTNMFGFNPSMNASVLMPLLGSNGVTMMYEHKF